MTHKLRKSPALLASLLLAAAVLAGVPQRPAFAVDTVVAKDAPDLAAVRAKIKAADWKGAIADLDRMIGGGMQHADVYNLLGYSLRNSGDNKTALTYYRKALDFDPNHKGALEYLGELYVKTGELALAREQVARLQKLCPQGCAELDDLKQTLSKVSAMAK
ncbi:MAG: tetratricopeptide repeat protein [Proteobacteria bacterium]|nr:tetratricopeptide repeat protein [Pseudomonadota bacterium]